MAIKFSITIEEPIRSFSCWDLRRSSRLRFKLKSNGRSRLIHRPLLSQAFEGRNFREFWGFREIAAQQLVAVCGRVGIPLTDSCRQRDLRIRCGLWTAGSVIGIGDRVTAEDQIDWRIILVHDAFDKDHA